MKTKMCLAVVILMLLTPGLSAASVTFKITGLRNDKGVVWVGIYNSPDTFLKRGKQVTDCDPKGNIKDGYLEVVCTLEPGTYGAAAYHDENKNRHLDTNFLGIPKEGYGFPNGVKARFSTPDFEEVTFSVDHKDVVLEMEFQYL